MCCVCCVLYLYVTKKIIMRFIAQTINNYYQGAVVVENPFHG